MTEEQKQKWEAIVRASGKYGSHAMLKAGLILAVHAEIEALQREVERLRGTRNEWTGTEVTE